MSFTDTRARDLRHPFAVDFIGLDNYTKALSDPTFLQAARNTAYFVLVGVPLTMALALAAAVALDRGITRLRAVFRVGFYLPVVTSIVAVAVVWRFLLQDDVRPDQHRARLGRHRRPQLARRPALGDAVADPDGGLAQLRHRDDHLPGRPAGGAEELHEAAAIDGAGAWQRFRHITLPLLRPTLLFVAVTTGIGYLQFFEEPFVMTRGGPLEQHDLVVASTPTTSSASATTATPRR